MSEPLPKDEASFAPGTPPVPPAPKPVDAVAYQPISGWAVAGLATSGAFAVLVVATAIVALFKGAPVFFPIWMLSAAVVGIILSYIGQRHVETSENTRSGLQAARIGLWLGIVSGLGYFSYFYATGWALETQANSFLMEEANDSGFFPRLKKGGIEINAAFLLTRAPQDRFGRAEDERAMQERYNTPGKDSSPGQLTLFRESQIPRALFGSLARNAKITPGPVQEWRHEKRSYVVVRHYYLETDELEAEYRVTAISAEGEGEGQGRTWYVNLRESFLIPDTIKLTPVGTGVKMLRMRTRDQIVQWTEAINAGQPIELKDLDKTAWDLLPHSFPNLERDKLREAIYRGFRNPAKGRLQGLQILSRPETDIGNWTIENGKLRIYITFRMGLLTDIPGNPGVNLDIIAGFEALSPVYPAQFTERSPSPEWKMISLTFVQATPLNRGPV